MAGSGCWVRLLLTLLLVLLWHSGDVFFRWNADLAGFVLIALFTTLLVLLQGIHIIAPNGNWLCSRSEGKNGNNARLSETHRGRQTRGLSS